MSVLEKLWTLLNKSQPMNANLFCFSYITFYKYCWTACALCVCVGGGGGMGGGEGREVG